MISKWLKSILPKGLYGRAALILILPVIGIQFVVSVVFIQRHFEDVTDQMTSNVVLEIRQILKIARQAQSTQEARIDINNLATPLGFVVRIVERGVSTETQDKRDFLDLSGLTVISTLRDAIPDVLSVDLSGGARVQVLLRSEKGQLSIGFARTRVSAANPHQLLVLMIATSILMTVISFVFLRNQVRPIRRLARAAEAFGKGQNVSYSPSGATEVRSAGRAFLDMRARIERQIEQRTLMLSGVSHDLRTPLTRLKLGLAMLPPQPETQALIQDVDDMEVMLEEFLAFSRGDSTEDVSPTDPVTLAEDLAANALRGKTEVALVIGEDIKKGTMLAIRPMAVRRAIENLLTNAGRYGTRVRLTLERDEKAYHFVVEDNGPGIPPAQREEALRPFTRLDSARNQNYGTGVGLGLSIAMDIASSHGGALDLADSDDLGGLKATFTLPR